MRKFGYLLSHALFEKTLDDLNEARVWMTVVGRKFAIEKIAVFLLKLSRMAEFAYYPQRRLSETPSSFSIIREGMSS